MDTNFQVVAKTFKAQHCPLFDLKRDCVFTELFESKDGKVVKKRTFQTKGEYHTWKRQIIEEMLIQRQLAQQFPDKFLQIIDYSVEIYNHKRFLYITYDCDKSAQSLFKYIEENQVNYQEQINIVEQLLQILCLLQKQNCHHANLKPDNLIYYKKKVLLTDFGSARTHYYNFTKQYTGKKEKYQQNKFLFFQIREYLEILQEENIDFHDEMWKKLNNEDEMILTKADKWAISVMILQVFENSQILPNQINQFYGLNEENLTKKFSILEQNKNVITKMVVEDLLIEDLDVFQVYQSFQKHKKYIDVNKDPQQFEETLIMQQIFDQNEPKFEIQRIKNPDYYYMEKKQIQAIQTKYDNDDVSSVASRQGPIIEPIQQQIKYYYSDNIKLKKVQDPPTTPDKIPTNVKVKVQAFDFQNQLNLEEADGRKTPQESPPDRPPPESQKSDWQQNLSLLKIDEIEPNTPSPPPSPPPIIPLFPEKPSIGSQKEIVGITDSNDDNKLPPKPPEQKPYPVQKQTHLISIIPNDGGKESRIPRIPGSPDPNHLLKPRELTTIIPPNTEKPPIIPGPPSNKIHSVKQPEKTTVITDLNVHVPILPPWPPTQIPTDPPISTVTAITIVIPGTGEKKPQIPNIPGSQIPTNQLEPGNLNPIIPSNPSKPKKPPNEIQPFQRPIIPNSAPPERFIEKFDEINHACANDGILLSLNKYIRSFQLDEQLYQLKELVPENCFEQIQEKKETIKTDNFNKHRYQGFWFDGSPHGFGTLREEKNSAIYRGVFKMGKFFWGQVLEINESGLLTQYIGYYHNQHNVKNGKSKMTWFKPQMSRLNNYTFVQHESYEGQFVLGRIFGKGKKIYSNGSFYEGEWKNNLRDGKGKFVQKINNRQIIYIGSFKSDYQQGECKAIHDENKNLYEIGEYEEGKPIGIHNLFLGDKKQKAIQN